MDVENFLQKLSQTFGISLYNFIREDDNATDCFSPWSLVLTLLMTSAGSEGNTGKQLRDALGLTEEMKTKDFHEKIKVLLEVTSSDSVLISNSIFFKSDIEILPEFKDILEKNYRATIESVDFEHNRRDAVKSINDWASAATNGKINEVVRLIDPSTVMYLMNAVYFKSDWLFPFEKCDTKMAIFHHKKDDYIMVNTMNKTAKLKYFFHDETDCQVLELPYADNKTSMWIFLPQDITGLSKIEDNLSVDFLNIFRKGICIPKSVKVQLPSFKISQKYILNSYFHHIGITDLFNEDTANLEGMSKDPSLYVTGSSQDVFIEVNEEGTEAAAVTSIVADGKIDFIEFKANRPFLFMIFSNDFLLFVGKVVYPD